MKGRIANHVIGYSPFHGGVQELRENPIPQRAIDARAREPYDAVAAAGLGRIDWRVVSSYTKRDVKDFASRYEISALLAENAKTMKPRPSGNFGKIAGMNLSPHFYPNLLNGATARGHALDYVDRETFYRFNGATPQTASDGSGVPAKALINFCTGASKYCRQTCLVTTGQHPSTREAAHSKMKHTWALLNEPELFVALLVNELQNFGRAAARAGFDAVVRLNMLSDVPWYMVCPEIFEALEGEVTFYDYTKLKYWGVPEYERVRHLLDLTFSFSGSNDKLCADALRAGERVAAVFAPNDPTRSASVAKRTTWKEIMASGLVNEDDMTINLFGGDWTIVDGDQSDYRIDDPQPSIVALNFKAPNLVESKAPHMKEALPESRKHFTVKVPDKYHVNKPYVDIRSRRAFWAKHGIDVDDYSVEELLQLQLELEGIPDVDIDMAPIEGTNLLIGPTVPTVTND